MRISRFIVLIAAFLLMPACLFAQVTAELTGSVTSDGKPLPGVTVTISAPTMQGSRTAYTGENGGYQFSGLTPGEYTVHFELSGLAPTTQKVSVKLSQTARADADLKVASVTEAITVTASTPTVLETPQVAATFTSKQLEQLPVGRSPIAAALLAPGVNNNTLSANQFSISGSPGYDNLVLVNGVVVTENVRSQVQNLYIEDAIQETTVLSGAISAEYGRFTGGVVNSITKSGGNTFTGSFRDSLTNPAWTALTPLAGQVKPASKIDKVYEETLGGYAIKDRLWFFGAGRQANRSINRATTAVTSTTIPGRNLPAKDYLNTTDQKRYEIKLTGQITPKHSLVGSYLKVKEAEGNNAFTPIYDDNGASLVQRELPNALYSYHYNGVLTTNTLIEAQYSRRTYAFVNSGSRFQDLVKGTLLLDRSNNNTRFNSPTFCGVCATETRDNGEYIVKGNYYLNTRATGNHNFIVGFDNFKEKRFAENHQSGSDYRVFVTTVFFDQQHNIYPQFKPDGTTFIRWTPIFVAGGNDKVTTKSAFLNDKIDFNSRWSFNLGVRYDKNDAIDADGTVASKDSAISPRLTAMFDPFANGRHRLTLSYNRYASRIVEGVAGQNQNAGNPGSIDYNYSGPAINPDNNPFQTPNDQAIQQAFAWFASQCGGIVNGTIDASKCNSLLRPGGSRAVPGFSAVFDDRLKSPSVGELAFGYGMQIGGAAYAKIDLISRKWRDFYGNQTIQTNPEVTTPIGIPVDLTRVINSNEIKRSYRAVQVQAQWNPHRLQTGVNYTWSKLRGNDEGENAGSGPILNQPLNAYYPEFAGSAQRLPVGYLEADQRHRLRAWVGYDILASRYGNLNASLLESYDSGRPYPSVFTTDLLRYTGAPNLPGYVGGGPATANYYLCRDCNRFEDSTHTDLAMNYSLPIWRVQLFVRATVTNLFNESALTGYDTGRPDATGVRSVSTQINAAGNQSANFAFFNPFTQTPLECPSNLSGAACKAGGFNYQKASNFGQATAFTGFQPARTYAGSVGIRF